MSKIHSILCPFCRSHSVVRNGFNRGKQRYQCKDCRRKFCNTQKRLQYKEVYDFLLNKSLRNIEPFSKDFVHREIIAVARKLPNCKKINRYLALKFSGRISLDAIYVSVAGVQTPIFFAIDLESLDIIDYGIYQSETEISWYTFLEKVSASLNGVYPKLFVSDGKKGINNALRRLYEFVPRQVCIAHKLRRLQSIFPRRKLSSYEKVVKQTATEAILARTIRDFIKAEYRLQRLVGASELRSVRATDSKLELRKTLRARGVLRYQRTDFLTQYFHKNLVQNDRSNNSLEGLNSILKTRTRLFRGFKSKELFPYWMTLLVFYYRFHKLKASKYPWRKNRRPVEINSKIDYKRFEKITGERSYSWIENLSKFQ